MWTYVLTYHLMGRVEPYIGCPYPWVLGGMGVILLFMGGHGWAWFMGGFS